MFRKRCILIQVHRFIPISRIATSLIDVLRRSGKVKGWETTLKRRNGTLIPVRLTGLLTPAADGKPELFSTYVEDITQQSTLERQVRQVQKLEAVGRLAGGMAHDFNNVLVVIKLSTEMMLGQITPDSPFSKPLLQISNAADRAAALTKQMLAFGRQQMMQPRIINLNSVVNETAHMLRQVIGEDIELVTELAPNVENSKLDPDQVTQVIMNLAVNARDAMPQGGTLHIETKLSHPGRSLRARAPSGSTGKLCDDVRQRHGYRYRPINFAAHLRSILHHKRGRQGNRPGTFNRVRDRETKRWLYLGL